MKKAVLMIIIMALMSPFLFAADAATVTVSFSTNVITPGNGARIAVQVLDASGNPCAGKSVAFYVANDKAGKGRGEFNPAAPVTGADGKAYAVFMPSCTGDVKVAAVIDGKSFDIMDIKVKTQI